MHTVHTKPASGFTVFITETDIIGIAYLVSFLHII